MAKVGGAYKGMLSLPELAGTAPATSHISVVDLESNEATTTIGSLQDSIFAGLEDFVFVSSKDKFPDPVNGIITLADNATYILTKNIDLTGDRIVGGQNSVIMGGSSENTRLTSTGLTGTALITSNYSLPLRFLAIEANIALDLDGDQAQALDWVGVNFVDTPTVGTIKNYANFIMSDCAFLNSSGLTFDGEIGTVGFNQCLFDAQSSGTSLILAATATITRRFRLTYSAFIALSGETSLNISDSATLPTEGYILDTANFAGGGTFVSGIQHDNNKALFVNCIGIENSSEDSYLTMLDNSTVTTITTINTPVKVLGTTVNQPITQKFTNTANRATYNGAIDKPFIVHATASLLSGNNNQIAVYLAKNGTVLSETRSTVTASGLARAEIASPRGIIELQQNDFIEVWVENKTGTTDVTVVDLSLTIGGA